MVLMSGSSWSDAGYPSAYRADWCASPTLVHNMPESLVSTLTRRLVNVGRQLKRG